MDNNFSLALLLWGIDNGKYKSFLSLDDKNAMDKEHGFVVLFYIPATVLFPSPFIEASILRNKN
jgi:hypothetical protein